MRITYLPRNIDGAGWYRCFFPAHYLEQEGHFAKAPPMGFFRQGQEVPLSNGQLPDGWVDCIFGEWPDADIYVFQMPLEQGTPEQIQKLQKQGKKVVVELDDDYLHIPAYNPFVGDARYLHKCVSIADAVSVSTPSLKSSYKHLNKNITVLQNRLYWPMWEEVTLVYEQTWRQTRIGYMGILDFHSADLEVIKPWFGKWINLHPQIEFVSAGDSRIHDFLEIPEAQRITTDSVDFRHLELGYITASFDIGLVPLVRNKFNEGKSYLKGLEYSACGIIPIATPTEQYRTLIRDGVDGYLCDSPKAWIQTLDNLVARTKSERRSIAIAAREKARSWSYDRHIGEWIDFYRSLGSDSISSRTLWDVREMQGIS